MPEGRRLRRHPVMSSRDAVTTIERTGPAGPAGGADGDEPIFARGPGSEEPRFELLGRLGAGGMGVVYAAHDRERNTRVAVKALRVLDPQWLLYFKNEFRALQDLEHPNLVSLGELFNVGGRVVPVTGKQ